MLECQSVYNTLSRLGIRFFAGVPDSLLKDFCAYVTDHSEASEHFIAANEGSAVALAAGHHLATGRVGLVYLQNSGQGNALNPLVSLADPAVYAIPMLLLIGWRGEPGRHDEPQHVRQGQITLPLLQCLGIDHEVLPDDPAQAEEALKRAVETAKSSSAPYALVVRKATFRPYPLRRRPTNPYTMTREQALQLIVDRLPERAVVVSTTGKASRELFEYRQRQGQDPGRDFLTVGSMGHASQIALGVACSLPDRPVYCLDGDGAAIMHMGGFATIGVQGPNNFKHLLINNGVHDSVGGQPTGGLGIDFAAVARACGYRTCATAQSASELESKLESLSSADGPLLLEIRTTPGARAELGRPTTPPRVNKEAFMRRLQT